MASIALKFFIFIILSVLLLSHHCKANTWIRGGYWYVGSESPIPSINSALFTHLLCAFATVNSSTFELSIPDADEQYFSSFTSIVKSKNPSISTVLSIWNGQESTANGISGEQVNVSVLSSMISQQSHRKSFVRSSIKTARLYGFHGIDLFWLYPTTASDMTNLAFLLDEWREAINSEQTPEGQPKLTLSMAIRYLPTVASNLSSNVTYPIDSLERNLDWAHIVAYDYHLPLKQNHTGAHAALYDPPSNVSTDYGIEQWINEGLKPGKIVLGIPYHGYAWTLVDPKDGSTIGAPAIGPALTKDGAVSFQYIMSYIRSYGAKSRYDASYVVNEYTFGRNWIGFDDVEAIRAKVSYGKQKGLLGYKVFVVTNDDNWELSQAAAQDEGKQAGDKKRLLLIIILPIASIIIFVIFFMFYLRGPIHMPQGFKFFRKATNQSWRNVTLGRKNSGDNGSGLRVFSYDEIKDATDNFSSRNLLGEGGFGTVYKGQLRKGEEIAVKILSRASRQGAEEFWNEVTLTASLQHVNLIRVIGYCTDREERALVYKYMPNRSLDTYLFEPERSHILDWEKRVRIIDGVIQGLLYLQEYSNFTIVHRDLKASNILLDENLNPKISDFGMAKLFREDGREANTERIVGTYGYIPPEYVKKGIYSIKYDVYSFGVLLQIISGKRTSDYYGSYEDMNLYELAYELWRSGKGKEFMDPSLDDSSSSCKMMTCLQVALLCVQENPEDRPTMLEVFSMIKSNNLTVSNPKKPAFALKMEQQTDTSTSQQEIFSVGDASISQLFPR